jgi:hypothetical protein
MDENIGWSKLITCLVLLTVTIICSFNAAQYNKIYQGNKDIGTVTPSSAQSLMVINIIIAIFSAFFGIYFFYYSYILPKTWQNNISEALVKAKIKSQMMAKQAGTKTKQLYQEARNFDY